jgi:bifunctional DNA-binding transcriptional regulator/antitoxin component of YhaV-PrlF toxin-antitoxin module
MSGEVRTDKRGRVTIPKEVRNRYGEKFRLVELDSGIKLVPISDDPLEELRGPLPMSFVRRRSMILKKR